MKKAFKIIVAVSAFAIVISTFCACDMFSEKEDPSATPIVATAEDSTTTKPDITRPDDTDTSSTTEKIEVDSLDTILNNIKDFPSGTTGSTTKAYQIAYKLLNYTENSNYTVDEAQHDYENFVSSLSEEEKDLYLEYLDEINACANNIINDPSLIDQHLEGYKPITESGKLTSAKYEALYVIISK